MVEGKKGKGTTIQTNDGDYNPETTLTINRGEGKCPTCQYLIESYFIDPELLEGNFDHLLYAIGYKQVGGGLKFRLPTKLDLEGVKKAKLASKNYNNSTLVPSEPLLQGQDTRCYNRGVRSWAELFNPRQLLTLVTYARNY